MSGLLGLRCAEILFFNMAGTVSTKTSIMRESGICVTTQARMTASTCGVAEYSTSDSVEHTVGTVVDESRSRTGGSSWRTISGWPYLHAVHSALDRDELLILLNRWSMIRSLHDELLRKYQLQNEQQINTHQRARNSLLSSTRYRYRGTSAKPSRQQSLGLRKQKLFRNCHFLLCHHQSSMRETENR